MDLSQGRELSVLFASILPVFENEYAFSERLWSVKPSDSEEGSNDPDPVMVNRKWQFFIYRFS